MSFRAGAQHPPQAAASDPHDLPILRMRRRTGPRPIWLPPAFIEQLRKIGYTHVELEQLIAFRIHGVSPEFIEKLHGLGYKNPSPDELVAMRIHGVTPEYIAGLKSRGMKDLSIDQLISLRIHGID